MSTKRLTDRFARAYSSQKNRQTLLGSIAACGALSLMCGSPAQAQSPGGNLGALLARLQVDEANIASMQSTITSQQNTIDQMTSGGVKPAGPASGDLSGSFPGPTIAPNAIGHTKLASDSASLFQVSGGLLAASGSGASINGDVGIKGDLGVSGGEFFLAGQGGGDGNNNHRALALKDGGPGQGLILNYQNDFGSVNVQSDLYVGGGVISNVDVNAARFLHSGSNIYSDLGIIAAGDIVAGGQMSARVLQINGGSDLAEPYKIAAAAEVKPLPGMVVAIDPQQTGQMRVCAHAYDNTVAGIISGAGGVQPGVVLRQAGTVADGTLPIASLGRVWCLCDAGAGGPIAPGDLLTTSNTPGHAMRVGDYGKAQGAVLGKAMSRLKSGKGLVLVLVTLE